MPDRGWDRGGTSDLRHGQPKKTINEMRDAVKTYRRHYCQRTHRQYRALAKCIWKRAEWVMGDGPYATLARCRVLTIELHETFEQAQVAKSVIDSSGCGGACWGRPGHEIVMLANPDTATEWN